MNIFTGLVALIVTLMVVAYVVQPFFSRRVEKEERRTDRHMAAILHQRADLLAKRDRIYQTINELDFDHATNKVSDEDYARQRRRLVAQGVEVLQQLDALEAARPLRSGAGASKRQGD
jgi:hypothetical protein